MLEKLFGLKKHGTNVRTEVLAGVTTFFTMVYIVAVNPGMLSETGMDYNGVFVASIIAAIIGTLIMGLYANVPYAQAAGMGLNAFFTYTVVKQLGYSWQEALGLVFICGFFNIIITVTSIRKVLIKAIPKSLQHAIGGGIGLFISYMGLQKAGFLSYSASEGSYAIVPGNTVIIDGSGIVPSLATFNNKIALVGIIGLILTLILMVRKVKGAIFIGIVVSTLISIPLGITALPEKVFDLSVMGGLKNTAGAVFSSAGLPSLFKDLSRLVPVLLISFSFTLSDTFDSIGTFIGTGVASGIFDEKELEQFEDSKNKGNSRLDKALIADSVASTIGSVLGTSNVTTYVESASGIAVGGRTGLTSVVIAGLFALCLPFGNVFAMIPAVATAPALIIVGVLMAGSLKDIEWTNFEEAVPAFFTIAMMPFAYSVTEGIAFGFIFYALIKIVRGKIKEAHPVLLIVSVLFILNYVMLALGLY